MLTTIAPRESPAKGPTTDLDRDIVSVLSDGIAREPREIIQGVTGTLPQLYARLRVLVNRGVILRLVEDGAPARGPGAGKYCKT